MHSRLTASLLLVLLAAACTEDPTAPTAADMGAGAQGTIERGRPDDHNPPQLFTVTISVQGPIAPGTESNVTVAVASLFPTDAVVTLRAPEIRAAAELGIGPSYAPLAEPAETIVRKWQARTSIGQQSFTTSIRIPAEGVYQLVATAEPAHDHPERVVPVSHAQVWLDVATTGARVVAEQPDQAAGTLPGPGPRRHASMLRNVPGIEIAASAATTCWIDGVPCEVYPVVSFYDRDYGGYVPLANVRVNLQYLDQDPYDGHTIIVANDIVYTDAQGRYKVNCRYHSYLTEGVIVVAGFESANSSVAVYRGDASSPYTRSTNHGDVWQLCQAVAHDERYFWVGLADDEFQVFRNLATTIVNSRALMGYSRGWLKVKTRPGDAASNYSSWWDDVEIYAADVWGDWGKFTAAHEYGHALHEEGLNGNVASGECPSPHYIDGASNPQCAFSEGFSDFHGVYTMPAPRYLTSGTTINRAESVWRNFTGGASTEGKVAAFLLDLADNSASPDGIAGDDDGAAYGGRYVGDGIRNCVVTWREDVSRFNADQVIQQYSERASSASTLIHCFMGQISTLGQTSRAGLDSQNNIITLRAVSATSITTTGWSPSVVSSIWQNNIPDSSSPPPPPPPPSCVDGPTTADCQVPTVARGG